MFMLLDQAQHASIEVSLLRKEEEVLRRAEDLRVTIYVAGNQAVSSVL